MSASGTWATTPIRGPGYDPGSASRATASSYDPEFNENGSVRPAQGLHHRPAERARGRVRREAARQAVRAVPRAQGGASRRLPGRRRHARPDAARRLQAAPSATRTSTRASVFPPRPNVLPLEQVVAQKPAWAEAFELAKTPRSQAVLKAIHVRRAGGDPPARGDDGLGRRGRGHALRRRWSRPASSTTRSSCSSATTAISSASTGSGPSAASPTRKASARRSSCAIRAGSRRA